MTSPARTADFSFTAQPDDQAGDLGSDDDLGAFMGDDAAFGGDAGRLNRYA